MSPIPAKPTFGTVKPLLYPSDYLDLKNARAMRSYYLMNKYNKYNLVYNLYSKENLKYVSTVGSNVNSNNPTTATKINPTLKPFYQFYNIDYKGQLFGNSQCGELNYVNYVEPQLCKGLEKK